MSDDFHLPASFDDSDDDPPIPFRQGAGGGRSGSSGSLKDFKKRLKEHGKTSGNEAMATKAWRNHLRTRPKKD